MIPDRTLPFAFVDDLDTPRLDDADHHHLARVRRVRPGDAVVVGDGQGAFRRYRFGSTLEPDGPVEHMARPEPALTVAFALTKGGRPELVVQKLTELGIDRIVPFVADRTIVRWDGAKTARSIERWRAIAREAAAQAHRPWLPEVAAVAPASEVLTGPHVTLADPDGEPPTLERTTVAVGPEGGWSPDELGSRHRTRLSPLVLRADTAAVAAGAIFTALRGNVRL